MRNPYAGHSVRKPADFPTGEHLAIIKFGTIHIPGDERSRTCPGHGYPASTEVTLSYYWYDNEQDWKEEIDYLEKQKNDYIAIKNGKKVTVSLTANISIT